MAPRAGSPADILALVDGGVELPAMPEVLVRLDEVMADADSTAAAVAAVASRDPAVAATLLRTVNSAHYGLQSRVSSLSLAVSVLGFNATRRVALRAAVFSRFGARRQRLQHFDPLAFWRHAVYAGVAARVLGSGAPVFADVRSEDMYIAGLLHDIGKVILMERLAPRYLAVLRKAAQQQRPEPDVELEEFGFTHADVGAALAIRWSLPEDLAIAIRYHHAPLRDPFHRSLSSLIHVADQLAWRAGCPSTVGTVRPPADAGAHDRIGLEPARAEALLPAIQEDFAASDLPW